MMEGRARLVYMHITVQDFYFFTAFTEGTQDGYNTMFGYSDGFGARKKGGNRNIIVYSVYSIIVYVYDCCNN
jgi:hypothetical protein